MDIAQPTDMDSPVRATAIVGLSSVVALGLSVVTNKVLAALIGPLGIGHVGLLQTVLNIAAIAFSVGLGTIAVRGAAAMRGSARAGSHDLTVIVVATSFGLTGGLLIALFRDVIAVDVLDGRVSGVEVALVAGALVLMTTASAAIALLAGRHQIRTVAGITVATALVAAIGGVALIAAYGEGGIAPMLLTTAAAEFVFAGAALARTLGPRIRHERPRWTHAADLIAQGTPLALSQLVGVGVQLGIPIAVLHALGPSDVGLYRAAATISVGYLTFFLASLTQDFLPRISGARSEAELGAAVEKRMRLVMGLGTPIIVALLAMSPVLLSVLYSSAFEQATELLRWQLVGDLLRVPAWVLSFVLIARGRILRYFLVEAAAGVVLLGSSLAGLATLGLPGAGVAYALTQIVHWGGLWLAVQGQAATRPGRLQLGLLGLAGAAGAVMVTELRDPWLGASFAAAALAVVAVAWPRLWKLHRSGEL